MTIKMIIFKNNNRNKKTIKNYYNNKICNYNNKEMIIINNKMIYHNKIRNKINKIFKNYDENYYSRFYKDLF